MVVRGSVYVACGCGCGGPEVLLLGTHIVDYLCGVVVDLMRL